MGKQLHRISYFHGFVHDQNTNVQGEALQQAEYWPATILETNGNEPFVTPTARRQLLDFLNVGDQLIVYHLDRLARSEHARKDWLQQLRAMGVTLVIASDDQKTIGDSHEE